MNLLCWVFGHKPVWRRRCDGASVGMKQHCARCGDDVDPIPDAATTKREKARTARARKDAERLLR